MTASQIQQKALELYSISVLKQEKLAAITRFVGDTNGLTCLDIGADNGVVSLLLRQRGGTWTSADLDARSVEAIAHLLGEGVHQIDGCSTPFAAASFDRVVIVDFLEHVHTDAEFIGEVARILKPDGRLIVNVPHLQPRSLVNRVRHAAGLTDEKHGHVRPGYTLASLRAVLAPHFVIVGHGTYSRTFAESIDAAMGIAYEWMGRWKGRHTTSTKGTVVTPDDLTQVGSAFKALKVLYPALRAIASLDRLLASQDGYKLIVEAIPLVSSFPVEETRI